MAQNDLSNVRGAVYVPARAYNAFQSWRDYDPGATDRDVGFAARLGLDALRVFLSYERWLAGADAHGEAFEHLLAAADERGLGVVPILFESAGVEPTEANLTDRDPETACAVRSPSHEVVRNERAWTSDDVASRLRGLLGGDPDASPGSFVEWFLGRYGDDDRLLAVEVMNEPGGWPQRVSFARAMLRRAASFDPAAPLTMGCKSPGNNRQYQDPGLDVYQYHHNVPPTADDLRRSARRAGEVADADGVPVWLTEWQRTREEPPDRMLPNYASLAAAVRESDVEGDFFWSLMLKPAYLPKMRQKGRVNGVFHEDGAVWSLEDARALAGEGFDAPERRERPAWTP